MFLYPRRVVLKAWAVLLLIWLWWDLRSFFHEPSVPLGEGFDHTLPNGTRVAETESLEAIPWPEASESPVETLKLSSEPRLATLTPELQCRTPSEDRYAHLRSFAAQKPRFFFALDLYQAAGILPQLTASILESIKFLGPEHCFLSIVQGSSTDGTTEMLQTLRADTAAIGLGFSLVHSDMHSTNTTTTTYRITTLAALRNLALAPLLTNTSRFPAHETTILFLNDISLCPTDILELLHQRRVQGADMACPMNFSDDGLFYDIWVARSMTGDIFFNIPPSGLWEFAKDLLWDDPARKRRLNASLPFQAFACWNGMAAMGAEPFLDKGIRFRRSRDERGECYMGEPTLLCKDLWKEGFGKIVVVPSVWVAYSRDASVTVEREKGYVEENVKRYDEEEGLQEEEEMVEWEKDPPKR
ncbi:MAG: hypothetical protein Q9197_005158 [Variospora fuerteventurae]